MVDEKKITKEEIKNEELTDEQANEAAGGSNTSEFQCEKCYKTYLVNDCFMVRGKKICRVCYYGENTYEPDFDHPVLEPELPGPPKYDRRNPK